MLSLQPVKPCADDLDNLRHTFWTCENPSMGVSENGAYRMPIKMVRTNTEKWWSTRFRSTTFSGKPYDSIECSVDELIALQSWSFHACFPSKLDLFTGRWERKHSVLQTLSKVISNMHCRSLQTNLCVTLLSPELFPQLSRIIAALTDAWEPVGNPWSLALIRKALLVRYGRINSRSDWSTVCARFLSKALQLRG